MMKYKPRFLFLLGSGLLIFLIIYLVHEYFSPHQENKNPSLIRLPWQKYQLTIAAGKSTGDSFTFAQKLAYIVNKTDSNLIVKVEETDGTKANLERLEKGKVQLAMAQADIPITTEAQLVSFLFPDVYQLIVKNNSGIDNVLKLRDKVVALPPSQGGQIESFNFLMNHYGLITNNQYDFKTLKDTDVDQKFCQKDSQVDAVFHVRLVGNSAIKKLLTECDGKFVPIHQWSAMINKHPELEEGKIPQGVYQGNPAIPAEDISTVSVRRLLLAHKNVPKEAIQEITRILYERRQQFVYSCTKLNLEDQKCEDSKHLKTRMPAAALISQPKSFSDTGKSIHPGALAYYNREQPSYLERYSGIFEVIVALVIPFISWLTLFQQRIEAARKNKADDYIREVTALMDAEELIKAILELINAIQVNNDLIIIERFQNLIIEKTAKILTEKKEAEQARSKNKISQDSLESFSKTLRKVVNAIEKLPSSHSSIIFVKIPQKAAEILQRRQGKPAQNSLLDIIINWFSLKKVQDINRLTLDLKNTLKNAMANLKTQKSFQDLSQFIDSEHQEISRDLDAIFKRSVNALVSERISQDSFQAFRVIWQIAKKDTDEDLGGDGLATNRN
ncbi:MAG: TAXI family TRAP transporter solute-binding subunit [Cyanobacteria bacterium P01_A01_bin.84]